MIQIKKFIPLVSFFLLLVIILSFPFLLPGHSWFFDFLKLPLKFFTFPGSIAKEIIFVKEIAGENVRLKKANAVLNYKLGQLLEMRNENLRLKALLDLKSTSTFNFVVAQVIAKDASNWMSTLVVNKGKEANIKEDCVVIGRNGLLGIVSDAGLSTSRIMLINDPNFNAAVMIERTRVQGLLSGSMFGGCRLRFLSKEDDASIGDLVITSGLNLEASSSLFPKGIPVGKIKFIGDEFSGLGKYCLLDPVENINRLEEVLVIIP